MTQAQQDYYRQAFELISGAISDRRWRQIRREMKRSGMKLSLKSVQNYARLKQVYPRTILTKSAITTFETFQVKHKDTQTFSGEELLAILRQINSKVTERSLINAFYKANLPFSRQSTYQFDEASKVVFFAAITRRK